MEVHLRIMLVLIRVQDKRFHFCLFAVSLWFCRSLFEYFVRIYLIYCGIHLRDLQKISCISCVFNDDNNNNNNNTTTIFMVLTSWLRVTAWVHPVHAVNAEQRQAAADLRTKPTDLSRWPACSWLGSYIHHRHLLLSLPDQPNGCHIVDPCSSFRLLNTLSPPYSVWHGSTTLSLNTIKL